jgi:hypothetical protein
VYSLEVGRFRRAGPPQRSHQQHTSATLPALHASHVQNNDGSAHVFQAAATIGQDVQFWEDA